MMFVFLVNIWIVVICVCMFVGKLGCGIVLIFVGFRCFGLIIWMLFFFFLMIVFILVNLEISG